MARKEARRATADEGPEAHEADARRRKRETVAQVAHALRHRDEIVASALGFLEAAGFIDLETRDRVTGIYESGDTATRLAIQELVARVLKVPLDSLDERLADGQVDPAAVSETYLERLRDLRLPQVDVADVARRVRGFDVDRYVAAHAKDNRLMDWLTDLPVMANHWRLGLLFGGIVLVVVAGVSLLFPQYALFIAFYGLIAALAFLGAFMVVWSIRLERGARALGLDLVVFSRLEPEERRVLLVRRIWVAIVDTDRLGDLVERSLHAMLPERMQRGSADDDADRVHAEAAAKRPARPRPRRPATDQDVS